MKAYLTSIGFALVLLMSGFHQAYAGSQQHGKPTFTPEAIATFSKDVEKARGRLLLQDVADLLKICRKEFALPIPQLLFIQAFS